MQGTWARLQFFMTILPLLWVELIQASTPYKVPPPDFPCWSPLGLCFDQHTFSSLSWADTEIPAPFIPVGPGLPVGRQLYPHSDVFSLSFLVPGYFLLFILIFFFFWSEWIGLDNLLCCKNNSLWICFWCMAGDFNMSSHSILDLKAPYHLKKIKMSLKRNKVRKKQTTLFFKKR